MDQFREKLYSNLRTFEAQHQLVLRRFQQSSDPLLKRIGELYIMKQMVPPNQKVAVQREMVARQLQHGNAKHLYWSTVQILSDETLRNVLDLFDQFQANAQSDAEIRILKSEFLVALYQFTLYPNRPIKERLQRVFATPV